MKLTFPILNEAQQKRLLRHMSAVRANWETVNWMKEGFRDGDLAKAQEAWEELDSYTQISLWVAPKFGGVWTTREREMIRSEEFRGAQEES